MPLQQDRPEPGADGSTRKAHYGSGEQPWDAIKRLGWAPEFAAANVLKYLRRTKDPEHSLQSARWYYDRLKELYGRDARSHEAQVRALTVFKNLMAELTDAELTRLTA